VREGWIKIDDVKPIKSPPRFAGKLRDMFERADSKPREHFRILLAHLAQMSLAKYQNDHAATIAAHVLMVKPDQPLPVTVPSGVNRQEIEINAASLVNFLSSPEGHEAGTLIGLGVKPELISKVTLSQVDRVSRRSEYFIPDSSPTAALEALEELYRQGP
jgi:hypothetical protein